MMLHPTEPHWPGVSCLLYTNNELSERKTKKTISFTTALKKFLGINLTKDVKDLYLENSKTFKKEMKGDTK